MSIGTTLKIGYDGTSVSHGLAGLGKSLGSFGKQLGIGAARRIGEGVTDLVGRLVTAIPQAISETADWAGNLKDMSAQTGASVKSLTVLQEAFRLSGAEAADTSKLISTFASNLTDAAANGGTAADALHKLGFSAQDFKGMKIDEAFLKVGKRISEMTTPRKIEWTSKDAWGQETKRVAENAREIEGLETIMADLFGAKMGYKLIRFFKDFDGSMKQAQNNAGALGDAMQNDAEQIDEFFDALGRWENFKHSISSMFITSIVKQFGGSGSADKLFDFLDPEKARPYVEKFATFIHDSLGKIADGAMDFFKDPMKFLGDSMQSMGRSFGDGIRQSFSIKDLLFGGGPSTKATSMNSGMSLDKTNSILTDIRKNVGVARFA